MIGLRLLSPAGKGLGRVSLWQGLTSNGSFCCPTSTGVYSGKYVALQFTVVEYLLVKHNDRL